MKNKIIFHCGSAKTGSTSIQNYLWANRGLLRKRGIHFCPRFIGRGQVDPLNMAVKNMRRPKKRSQAIGMGRARLADLFEKQGFHTVILSNESALGDPFSDHKKGFFPFHELALEAAQELFAGYDVQPVFFTRDQAGLLPSFYGQRIRQGAEYSLDDFAARACSFNPSWSPVVDRLQQSFCKSELELHTYEEFVLNPENYTVSLFSRLLGIEQLSGTKLRANNRAAKSHALSIMRLMNVAIGCLPGVSGKQKAKLKKLVRRGIFPILEIIPTGAKATLGEEEKLTCGTLYERDLQALAGQKKGSVQENRPLRTSTFK